MKSSEVPEISVEELMERIRIEVNRRKAHRPHTMNDDKDSAYLAVSALEIPQNWIRSSAMSFSVKDQYRISDFMIFYGGDFIKNAYLGILNRQPDPPAFEYYLKNLETGRMSKAEILGRLRFSSEGRAKRVYVEGLLTDFLIQSSFKIPIIGYFSRLGFGILNLPTIIKNFQASDSYVHSNLVDLHKQLSQFARSVQLNSREIMTQLTDIDEVKSRLKDEILAELDQVVSQKSELKEISSQKVNRLEFEELRSMLHKTSSEKANRLELEALSDKLHELSFQKADQKELQQLASNKADLSIFEQLRDSKADRNEMEHISHNLSSSLRHVNDFRRSLLDQERRLRIVLEEVRRSLPGKTSKDETIKILQEQDHLLDALYVSFEDQFRGTRAEIKERLEVYLPYIQGVQEPILGTGDAPILDVGCGRGEWLQLCNEHGLIAKGIDMNRVMVDEARQTGLDVVAADFVHYLQKQAANSVGVLTSFHLVEHLPLEKLIVLLDEALRVLTPGGMLILETPNPDNLIVGCRNFYMDPTHLRPLPSPMLRYLAEARGFVRTEIVNLNPVAEYEKDQNVTGKLADLMYGPRDYALLGYKP